MNGESLKHTNFGATQFRWWQMGYINLMTANKAILFVIVLEGLGSENPILHDSQGNIVVYIIWYIL